MDASAEDDFDCVRACTYVEEAEELAAIVRRVVVSRGAEAALVYQRFHQIVSCHSAARVVGEGAAHCKVYIMS